MLRKSVSHVRTLVLSVALTLSILLAGIAPTAALAQSTSTSVPGGDVSGTWSVTGSPYLVEGDLTVPAGQTLTIEPGVQVVFQSWYKLTVNGTLLAQGTAASPILFTGPSPSPGWLGIRFVNASDASLLDHVIVENGRASGAAPDDKGGGIYIENTSPTIRNSTIRNNYAKQSGGGLYLTGSNAILSGNTIVDNVVGYASASGGALSLYNNSNAQITNNLIRGNTVAANGGFSTASGYGGALYVRSSDPLLRGNLIADNQITGTNSHKYGGALSLYYADPLLVNNTITGNSAGTTAGSQIMLAGGAIFGYQSQPVLVNNLLWNDTPDELHGAYNGLPGSFTVAYSDVQGGQAGIVTNDNTTVNWLEGNLDADPLFSDPTNGDWSLQAGSPAIDAGTATFSWNGQVLVDLAPDQYNGAAPDMGAFEAEGSAPPANQPPVAVASATPTSGSAPLDVQFSAQGSSDPDGTIVAYAWDFGDSSPAANTADPAHTYDTAGTYQATLTVTDDSGASASDTVTIDVSAGNQAPTAVASATPTSGSAPLDVQFSAQGSSDPDGTIAAFAWDFGDGSPGATTPDAAHTYDTAGTYQATLTVTDDSGASASDTVTIDVFSAQQNRVHVQKQEVERRSRRGSWYARDKVEVVDQDGNSVAGALVTARYYGPNEGQVTGTTNGDGKVILTTRRVANPEGIWCFEILNITADGYAYDPAANVVTIQCEAQ